MQKIKTLFLSLNIKLPFNVSRLTETTKNSDKDRDKEKYFFDPEEKNLI